MGFDLLSLAKAGPERLAAVKEDLQAAIDQDIHLSQDPDNISLRSANLKRSARRLLSKTEATQLAPARASFGAQSQSTFGVGTHSQGSQHDTAEVEQSLCDLIEKATIHLSSSPKQREASFQSSGGSTGSPEAGAYLSDNTTPGTSLTECDVDSSDERDNLEMFQLLAAQGKEYYQATDYGKALKSLERALMYVEKLRPATREEADSTEVRLMLALVYLDRKDIQASEMYLAPLDTERTLSEGNLLLTCNAKFKQAEIYYQSSAFDEAQRRCRESMRGRQKVLGTKSMPYYESVQLLARIYMGKGDDPDAEVVLKKLPLDMQGDVVRRRPQTSHQNGIPLVQAREVPSPVGISRFQSVFSFSHRSTSAPAATAAEDSFPFSAQRASTLVPTRTNSIMSGSIAPHPVSGIPLSVDNHIRETLSMGGFTGNFDAYDGLVWAIKREHMDVVRALLEGIWITLPVAARRGSGGQTERREMKRFDAKNIGSRSCRRLNPLILAVEKDQTNTVGLLLHHGAPVAFQDRDDRSPLFVASEAGHLEIAQQLLARNAPVDDSIGSSLRRRRRTIWTPLHAACKNGHKGLVELLLEYGARADQAAAKGVTPLRLAVELPNAAILTLILEKGRADLNAVDEDGNTALMKATSLMKAKMEEKLPMVVALLAHGADVNRANRMKRSALIMAAIGGCTETVEVLLNAGANPNWVDANQLSALLVATRRGHTKIVEMLSVGAVMA